MENQSEINQVNSTIQSRRSVYPYQFERGKRIPDEIIWQILENANRAPTHKMTEPWRFIVYTGEGLQLFSKLQSDIYSKYAGAKFKENKHLNLINYPLMASHVIAVVMKRNKENKVPEIEEIIATAFAIENMYLTVAAYGLGGYLSTGGITYLEEAKPYFDLKDDDKLIGFFYVGYPAQVSESLTKRQPVKEKVKWVVE
ncbi:MAG TPA: nitroreductase [Hanamia sp.]|nr:nitroreductase [Hanamia sp.]